MSLASVDAVMKAKSAFYMAVLLATSIGVIFNSECGRAEDQAGRNAKPEIKTTGSTSKVPLPKRSKVVKKVQSPAPQAAVSAEDKGEPAGQLQPQIHASNAGISACFDTLARASSHVIDGPHRAFSFWDPKKLNSGTFRSVVALKYGGAISPRGAAMIVNSPTRDTGCDATAVQVVPTVRPCSAIQNSLIEKGKAVANLTGLALIQAPGDVSYLLLPTAGDGCTIISMSVFRGN